MMELSHYLPNEVLNVANFPEINAVKSDISILENFAMAVGIAVSTYNEGVTDKINVNQIKLEENIKRCRNVCEVLGSQPAPCFDVLLKIRELQMDFQELLYAHRSQENIFLGEPTKRSEVDL